MAGGLTRWDPLAEITQLRSRFDRLLDELGGQDHGAWMPAIDLVRHDDDLVVRVDLPGIKPAEVRIEVDDGLLTVSGEHEERRSEKDDDGRYLRRERRLGAFSRSIALPSGVDAKAIESETRDGVVEVTIPCPGTPPSGGSRSRPRPGQTARDPASVRAGNLAAVEELTGRAGWVRRARSGDFRRQAVGEHLSLPPSNLRERVRGGRATGRFASDRDGAHPCRAHGRGQCGQAVSAPVMRARLAQALIAKSA